MLIHVEGMSAYDMSSIHTGKVYSVQVDYTHCADFQPPTTNHTTHPARERNLCHYVIRNLYIGYILEVPTYLVHNRYDIQYWRVETRRVV